MRWVTMVFVAQRTEDPSPRIRLSREAIVRAGLGVLDRDGLEKFSMRAVAAEFGTSPASLYSHVRNKEELLALIFDESIGEAFAAWEGRGDDDVARPGHWTELLVERAMQWRQTLLRHPGLCLYVLGTTPVGPNYLRVTERFIAAHQRLGLSPEVVSMVLDTMELYVNSFVAVETKQGFVPGGGKHCGLAERIVRNHGRDVPPEQYPNIHELAGVARASSGERFASGLRALLQGIARMNDGDGGLAPGPAALSFDTPELQTLRLQVRHLDLQLRAMTALLETLGPPLR